MATRGNLKEEEKRTFDRVAEAYDERLGRYTAAFASDMVDMLYPQKFDAGLDVAGGTGAAGLKLAERVGPEGSVTIIDFSPEMVRLAEKHARERRLTNVRTRVMDIENLDLPDNSFDVITCSFGVMSFPDTSRAVAEMKRVLKPGGRIGFTVWSIPERFPYFAEPMSAFLRLASPLPLRLLLRLPAVGGSVLRRLLLKRGIFGFSPVRFGKNGSLERHLERAGFLSVCRKYCAHPLEFPDFEDYWQAMMSLSPPRNPSGQPPDRTIAAVRELLRRRLVNPKTGEVRLFNEAGVVLAVKPA